MNKLVPLDQKFLPSSVKPAAISVKRNGSRMPASVPELSGKYPAFSSTILELPRTARLVYQFLRPNRKLLAANENVCWLTLLI